MNVLTCVSRINKELLPSKNPEVKVLDLFAGCGGFSLGFESLGFERDRKYCKTYNLNLAGSCVECTINTGTIFPKTDVVIGGPPCQSFSIFGNQNGKSDTRNGLPTFISAVKKTLPKIWMFENVRGILYKNMDYFESSLKKLSRLGYEMEYMLLNAMDSRVPQNRIRVIAVGHHGGFELPERDTMTVTAGNAIGDTAHIYDSDSKILTPSMDKYITIYEKKPKLVNPRNMKLDMHARTITCRNIGGPTSDMQRVVLPDGRRRRLTVRDWQGFRAFLTGLNLQELKARNSDR